MVRGVVSLQACRGGKFDYGVESETTDGPATDSEQPPELTDEQVYIIHMFKRRCVI